jgi:hypothetical protein
MVINYLAVLIAAIAAFVFGAAWYGALGTQWTVALGKTAKELEACGTTGKMPVGPMIVTFTAELVMAVLTAGLMSHIGVISIKNGALIGGLCWLAFVVTTITVNNAYAGRKLALTIIDSGHWLGVLLIIGMIIGAFG